MASVKYDVIIIGAGPSGMSAAINLGKKGVKVLLLEAKTFPREKTCGGFISRKTLDLLEIPVHPYLTENTIHSLRFYSSRYDWINTNNQDLLGITVLRSCFDQYLAEEAKASGAVLRTGERVYHVMQSDDKVEVTTEKGRYEGRYAIGADGVISSIARIVGIQPSFLNLKTGFTLSQVVRGVSPKEPGMIELYCIPFLGGFGWCFPLKEGYNLGVGSSYFGRKALFPYFESFVKEIGRRKRFDAQSIFPKGAFIPAGGFTRSLGKKRILLAGDAAGAVDPFSGEGIHNAVLTGHWAAESIYKGLCDEKIEALRLYKRQYDEQLLPDLRYSLALSILSWRKNSFQFSILQHNPFLINWLPYIMKTPNCYGKLLVENGLKLPRYLFRMLSN